jgi:CBS domain-containing protein
MRCQDLMVTSVHAFRPDSSAAECARLMAAEGIGFVPVVDKAGLLLGVVTDRDLAVRVLGAGLSAETELRRIMTSPVITCAAGDELDVAERSMCAARVSRVIITDPARRVLGMLSLSDIARVEESGRDR